MGWGACGAALAPPCLSYCLRGSVPRQVSVYVTVVSSLSHLLLPCSTAPRM